MVPEMQGNKINVLQLWQLIFNLFKDFVFYFYKILDIIIYLVHGEEAGTVIGLSGEEDLLYVFKRIFQN